jgi:hypothetical protein
LTHTLLFLVFLTSLFHLLVLKLNFNKDRRRVDYFHREALKLFKNKAGKVEKVDESMGGSGVGRRVRVNMTEGGSHEYTGAGTLELVVVDDKVFLVRGLSPLCPVLPLTKSSSHTMMKDTILHYLISLLHHHTSAHGHSSRCLVV